MATYETNAAAWDGWNSDNGTATNDATVWDYWNSQMTITTDGSDNYVWRHWNTDQTVGINDNSYDYEATNIIWNKWNVIPVKPYIGGYVDSQPYQILPQKKAKNESRRAIRRKHAETKKRIKHERKLRIAAEEKQRAENTAQELLFDLIGEEQAELFQRTGRLFVKGVKFDWLITKTGKGNTAHVKIQKLKKDKVIDLCVRVNDPVPPSDRVIAFALSSKFDEEGFDKTANLTRIHDRTKTYEERELSGCANF